jgi:hypothetical protein
MKLFSKIINLMALCIWAGIGFKCVMENNNPSEPTIFFTLLCFFLCSIFFNNYQILVQEGLEQLIKHNLQTKEKKNDQQSKIQDTH